MSKREGDREGGICELTHLGLPQEIIASAGERSVWCMVVCNPLLPSSDVSPVSERVGGVLGGAVLDWQPGQVSLSNGHGKVPWPGTRQALPGCEYHPR